MGEISWLQALILGIIQGLTEFLPISSSGHLAIAEAVMGINGDNLTFAIAVHAATVLSILTVFGLEIWKLIQGLFKFQWNDETQYIAKLLLSIIPVAIVGVFFKGYVESIFDSHYILIWVAFMMLLTAALLLISYYTKYCHRRNITFNDAFFIGIAQAIASVFPGLSRSGTTIAAGIIMGNKKDKVAQFSFLMVIIPVLGEAFLDLKKGNFSFSQSGISPISLLIGFLSAYIVGTLTCKWMLDIVRNGKLFYFAFYCIAVAAIILGFLLFVP